MGHIAFAVPTIQRYHFHEQLARKLLRSEHRVTVLCGDPVTWRFYRTQGLPARQLKAGNPESRQHVPVNEFAQQDCRLGGIHCPNVDAQRLARGRIEGQLGSVMRYFETELPDLLLFHQGRSGLHQMIHFVAREFGCGVLHTGDGLLPHTMQWNETGIDGDSSCCRRTAGDYRDQPNDPNFLASALASMLGEAKAPPVARRMVHRPDLLDRVSGMFQAVREGKLSLARHSLGAWRRAIPQPESEAIPSFELPDAPYITVLLQAEDCQRLRLDAEHIPSHTELILAAQRAVFALDASTPIVVVEPPKGMPEKERARLCKQPGNIIFADASDALLIASLAIAIISVNHPLGLFGILAKTAVLHTGRSQYGIPGIATKTTLDSMQTDLPEAIRVQDDNDALHTRFLTRLLAYDHVWCDPDNPDANGLRGLVQTIEKQLVEGVSQQARPRYRAGPVWPLTCAAPPEREI